MKKLFGILILGLLWCNVSFAEWKKFMENESGSTMYFDPDTVKKYKGHIYVWTLTDYLTPGSSGIYSNKIHMQMDCAQKKVKMITYVFYKDQMAKGEEDHTSEGSDKWDSFAPNSVGEELLNYICKLKKF